MRILSGTIPSDALSLKSSQLIFWRWSSILGFPSAESQTGRDP